MPDSKITALASTGTGTDPANDPLVIVDVSDTSMAATGTTKKVTLNNLLACSPTATLASATITGDLTVRTNKLVVTSTGVGIGTATPNSPSHFYGSGRVMQFQPAASTANTFLAFSSDNFVSNRSLVGIDGSAASIWAVGGSAYSLNIGTIDSNSICFGAANAEQYRIAPSGVFTWYDGAGGTRMTLNSTGLGVGVSPELKLRVDGPTAAPATSGSSTTNGAFRIGAQGAGTNLCLDFGISTSGGFYAWLQSRTRSDYSVNYDLVLQPNGGNVGVGTASPAFKIDVSGSAGSGIRFTGNSVSSVMGETGGFGLLGTTTNHNLGLYTNGSVKATIDTLGNVGVGVSTFGTSAAKVLAIGTGTEPTTGPAGTVQLFTSTRSASNTIPAIFTEGSGVTNAAITNTTVTNKIAIKVNGTIYYLLATTSAA
jgi:hypothetical protein